MAALVTFRGSTVIAEGEGTYSFTSDGYGRIYEEVPVARGSGIYLHDLGHRGALLQLTLFFHAPYATFPPADVAARIAGFYTPTAGTLVVADHGSFANCVAFGKPQFGPQQQVKIPSGTSHVKGYRVAVTMLFRQLGN